MRKHSRPRGVIRQVDIDFLCLATFGQRALPTDMAVRIALRRELYDAIIHSVRGPRIPALSRGTRT